MKNNKKAFFTILLAIIVVSAVGVYLAWTNNLIPKFNKEQESYQTNSAVKNDNLDSVLLLTKNSGPLIITLANGHNVPGSEVTISAQSGLQITKQATSKGKVTYSENYFGFSSRAIIEISGLSYKKIIQNTYSEPSRYLSFKTPLDIKPGTYKLKVSDYTDPKLDILTTSNQVDFTVEALPVCKEGMQWNGKFCDYKNYIHDANGNLIPDCGMGKTWNGAQCISN